MAVTTASKKSVRSFDFHIKCWCVNGQGGVCSHDISLSIIVWRHLEACSLCFCTNGGTRWYVCKKNKKREPPTPNKTLLPVCCVCVHCGCTQFCASVWAYNRCSICRYFKPITVSLSYSQDLKRKLNISSLSCWKAHLKLVSTPWHT